MNHFAIDDTLIDEGRQHAQQRLLANGSELGLLGSSQAYRQVWARDSMICGLGLLLCDDPSGAATRFWHETAAP